MPVALRLTGLTKGPDLDLLNCLSLILFGVAFKLFLR